MCALKKIKMDKHQDGFPLTSIRESNILLSFHHPNIVEVSEVGPTAPPAPFIPHGRWHSQESGGAGSGDPCSINCKDLETLLGVLYPSLYGH